MRPRSLTFAAVAVALLGACAAVAHRIGVAGDKPYDIAFVPRASSLRWMSLGHPTLAANLMWLRTVQYMGEPRGDERGWEKLHPAIDLVTDLDPRHGYAYQVAGNFLGSVGRVAESNALLEKGHRNVPDRYILPFHRAVNAFLYAGDYALAGRWFEKAAATPGAPSRMRDYALSMYVKGDAHETALTLLSDLYAQAEDEDSRNAVRKQMQQTVLEHDARMLERGAAAYRARYGFPPIALAQLEAAGIVPSIPADPFGGSYYLDGEGRVRSSVNHRRWGQPLSDEQRAGEIVKGQDLIRSVERAHP
jgi:tetratricopeptide (TPR) repeat protein